MTVEQFRISQVWWGLADSRPRSSSGCWARPVQQGARCPGWRSAARLGFFAILARDSVLSRQVRRRESQVWPSSRWSRICSRSRSPLARVRSVRSSGSSRAATARCPTIWREYWPSPVPAYRSHVALDGFASRSGLPVVRDSPKAFAVAIDRGTPLVDVLNAQAADVREASKRSLIESGARKEVAMMVPVVFLIMPVTLLFAFFPGVVGLNLLAP